MSGYLLASDLDGTLIHWPTPTVSDYDREAISKFRKAGNKFVVITGRSYGGAKWGMDVDDFPEIDAMLCLNGAYAMRPDGSEIYDKRTKYTGGREFVELIKESGAGYLNLDIGQDNYPIDIGQTPEGMKFMPVEELLQIDTFTAFTTGYDTLEKASKASHDISEKFGDMVKPLQNHSSVDMPGKGIDKGSGALFAAETFGIDEDKIYTVGDNLNDMHMIERFHGNAISHAPEALKEKAERTVDYVGDVIYYIMEELEK